MSVRRSSRAQKLIEKAVNYVCEELEARQLLTTAIGGMFGFFDSTGHFISSGSNTFEYRQHDGDVVRIALTGDIDVEFIGMQLGKGQDQEGFIDTTKKLVDLTPAFTGQTPEQSTDLFEIYIASSAPDATIAIATVPDLPTPVRPMQPFAGDSGTIRISDAFTRVIEGVTTGSGTGGVYIGARTLDTLSGTTTEQDVPILNVKRTTAFGLRPAPAHGRLGAGIFTAPGVNTGKILIGGAVTGNVNISGSIDTFYAGAILTGDATGLRVDSAPNINDNFFVGGDIHALYTAGAIGTVGNNGPNVAEPKYNTGFDLEVGGKVGEIFSATGDIYGGIHVRNDTKGWSGVQREVEFKDAPFAPNNDGTYFEQFGEIGDKSFNDQFGNDSFQSAQYLYTFDSKTLGQKNIAAVDGMLDTATNVKDDDDYYAVSLLAGQTVNAQLFKRDEATGKVVGASTDMHLGIFDPDGRLIASDYSFVNQTTNTGIKDPAQGAPLQFTADRPGVYRFAIATNGDTTFTAHSGTNVIGEPYELQIKNAGRIALGGVIADGNIYTAQTRVIFNPNTGARSFATAPLHAIDVDNGDLGSVVAGVHTFLGGDAPARIDATGAIIPSGSSIGRILGYTDVPYSVLNGNIRSIEGDDLGYGPEVVFLPYDANQNEGPNLYVHNGSVGLVRTWDAAGTAFLNDSFIDPVSKIGKTNKAVGGDYQLIDIAGTFSGTVIADRAIGVIRAAVIGSGKSYIVNADNKGNDGTIDLIDSAGDIGTSGGGGPAIVTGPGGNVRFMHAGGVAYRDAAFGGGFPETTTYGPGETADLRDDSGATVNISPTPNNVDFSSIAAGGTPTFIDPGRLVISTYPIRGDLTGGSSAGSVIVNLEVEAGAGGAQRGVEVKSNGSGSVDIGTLQIDSSGFGSTFDSASKTFTLANGVTIGPAGQTAATLHDDTVDVALKGDAPIGVFDLSGLANGPTSVDSIENSTSGELVNANLASVGSINVDTLGFARSRTGTEISGVENSGGADTSTYPFLQQRNFIQITGTVASVEAREGLGNLVIGTDAGIIQANSNERNVSGVFEGFNAPVTVGGELLSANIGEGLPSTGSGGFANAGIFATGKIDSVVNQGRGSDIRGAVLSKDSIDSIRLGDGGSIIGGQILIDLDYSDARAFNNGFHALAVRTSFNTPIDQIGQIKLTGNGGIIGSRVFSGFNGPISVGPGGFGILNSQFLTGGDGRFESVTADGYGIRDTTIQGGATVGSINATGHGQQLDANKFTPSVRGSAFGQFDSLSGYSFGYINDLYTTLAIKPEKTHRGTITKAGVIADTTITASRTLDSLSAWGIQDRVVPTVANPDNPKLRIPVTNQDATYPMRIAFGDEIGSVRVTNQILGLAMTAGTIKTISVGDDVFEARISGSSNIGTVSIGGTLRGNSTLFANGINGSITSLSVKKSLLGDVSAVKIGTVSVGRDLGSSNFHSSTNITTLNVGNDVLSGANVVANQQIGTLNIGDDLDAGAVIKAKSLGAFTIGGDQAGSLQIG